MLPLICLMLASCGKDSDNPIDTVLDVKYGAVLRTTEVRNNFLNASDPTVAFDIEIEEQDERNGDLLQDVKVYAKFKDNNTSDGDASTDNVLISTLQASDFIDGKHGLPRTDLKYDLNTLSAALGLSESDYTGGDVVELSLTLNLTDGRTFTSEDSTGSMKGSYFASPFKYNVDIKCIPTTAVPGDYTINMTDSYGDGWNGGYLSFVLDGKETKIGIPDFWEEYPDLNAELVWTPVSGYSQATAVFNVPEGSKDLKVSWSKGDWDSEVSYEIVGPYGALAVSESNPTAGTKILNICTPVAGSTSVAYQSKILDSANNQGAGTPKDGKEKIIESSNQIK